MRAALAAGASVAARDGNGWIALHEACRWGRLDAVRALVAAGSEPNAAHAELGFTPPVVATFTSGQIHAGLLPAIARMLGRVPRSLALEPMTDP